MPPSATGKKKPSRIVGSGFMATKDGLIVTSLAVVQGKGWNVPLTVRVEYSLPTGEYGRATGSVFNHSEQIGIAEIKVDPQKVPLKPLLLGDSDSIAVGEPVVALAVQGDMSLQNATGAVTQIGYLTDTYTGNDHVYLLDDNLDFPSAVQSQPLAELGGPLIDETGHVIAVVGPPGDMKGAWGYEGGVSQQALGIWWAIRDIKFTGVNELDSPAYRSGQAYLGVSSEWLTPQVARGLGEAAPGALVEDVYVGSPAAKAGIQGMDSLRWFDDYTYAVGGDVIVSVGGVQLTEDRQLGTIVGRHKPGDVIPVRLWRGDQLMTVKVKLAAAP
jgi:S1-C subfamily serine protease